MAVRSDIPVISLWTSSGGTTPRPISMVSRDGAGPIVSFITRQLLDMASPSNFPWTNPEIGRVDPGAERPRPHARIQNALDDWQRFALGQPPAGAEQYQVSKNLAATPERWSIQNRLIELIQYLPTTEKVFPSRS